MENKINIDDLANDASVLNSALEGLSIFLFDNLSCPDEFTVKNISAMDGLLTSIRLLATKHANEISVYSMGPDFKAND